MAGFNTTERGFAPKTPATILPTAGKAPTPAAGPNTFYPPAPVKPTFSAPATGINPQQSITSQPDQQIAKLIAEIKQSQGQMGNVSGQLDVLSRDAPGSSSSQASLSQLSQPFGTPQSDLSGVNAESASIKSLLAELAQGRGLPAFNAALDPAAVAYRNARTRQAQNMRAGEADALGASGTAGSGDFNARLDQIKEAAGQDIAGFEGDLSNSRRGEALDTAMTGATLRLSDLNRQTGTAEAAADRAQRAEESRRAGVATAASLEQQGQQGKTQSLQALMNSLLGQSDSSQGLLSQLLGEQGRVQGSANQMALQQTPQELLLEEMRQAQRLPGTPIREPQGFPAGTKFSATGAPILPRRG